jgi:ligand-binding sensor domain-containing protein
MWFATNFGVSRFDGYTFKNFDSQNGLPDNTIFEIYEDYKGRIWFISSSAKLSYYYNGSIYQYWNNAIFLSTIKEVPNIMNKTFSVDEQDNVYLGITYKGIFKITKKGKVTRKYPCDSRINCVALYVEKNIAYVDWRNYIKPKGIPELAIIKENSFFKLKIKVDKNLFFSGHPYLAVVGINGSIYYSENGSLYCVNDSLHYSYYKYENDRIISLYIDTEYNLWVGTYFGGFYCFKNGDISTKPELHLLNGKAGTSVTCDKEGGYWFSTANDGVFYIPSVHYKTYTFEDGLAENSLNILETDGKSILGAAFLSPYINNITNEKIGKIKLFNDPNKLITTIYFDKSESTLWLGTRKHLFRYKDHKLKEFDSYFNISDSTVYYKTNYHTYEITKDCNGNMWAATNGGLLKISKDKVSRYGTKNDLFRVFSIQEDKNSGFWIGCNDGLYKFINGKYIYYGDKNPLLKNRITFIRKCTFDDSFWIATKGAGILIMKGDSVKQVLQKDGLLSNHIKHLFIDKNVIWASSSNGLNKITLSKGNKESYKIEGFTQADGLYSNEVNSVLVMDSLVYVATDEGLCFFKSKEIQTNKTPPPVYITNLKIMDRDTLIQESYTLPYDMNFIEISFVGLTYRTAGDVIYKYRLSGINNEWVNTKSTKILYPFLPSGEYKFEVYAMNKDGVYSKTPAIITFIITPPFWKTWWFISLCLLAAAGIIRLIFYLRIKQIKRTNTLKLKLNKYMQQALSKQMNPHFIFNSLNSIQYYILKNDRASSNKYLAKFARLMRIILDNSQQQLITLQEELNALNLYVELEAMRFKEKFSYTITIDEKLDTSSFKIPPLLIQPYVENAIWHGLMHKERNGILAIDLSLNDNAIKCTITDNGIGREKAGEIKSKKTQTYKSHGTKITGDRLNLINTLNNMQMQINYFDLKDGSGNAIGTKVDITIPLIK